MSFAKKKLSNTAANSPQHEHARTHICFRHGSPVRQIQKKKSDRARSTHERNQHVSFQSRCVSLLPHLTQGVIFKPRGYILILKYITCRYPVATCKFTESYMYTCFCDVPSGYILKLKLKTQGE